MRPITTLARPFVAAPYIITGIETLRDPRPRAEQVAPTLKPVADRLDWLPTKDPVALVRFEGALSLGTGALLLTGKFRRLTTFLLAAQLVPSLATEHRYWTEDDPERRTNERSHLLKNASLFGTLLMLATEPRHNSGALRRKAHDAALETKLIRREAAAELKNARREAKRQIKDARREGGRKAARTAKAVAKGRTKSAKAAAKGAKAAAKGKAQAAKVAQAAKGLKPSS
jgi:uncharacterized membrane protein YphA (DoxX/SURF4 family)